MSLMEKVNINADKARKAKEFEYHTDEILAIANRNYACAQAKRKEARERMELEASFRKMLAAFAAVLLFVSAIQVLPLLVALFIH